MTPFKALFACNPSFYKKKNIHLPSFMSSFLMSEQLSQSMKQTSNHLDVWNMEMSSIRTGTSSGYLMWGHCYVYIIPDNVLAFTKWEAYYDVIRCIDIMISRWPVAISPNADVRMGTRRSRRTTPLVSFFREYSKVPDSTFIVLAFPNWSTTPMRHYQSPDAM